MERELKDTPSCELPPLELPLTILRKKLYFIFIKYTQDWPGLTDFRQEGFGPATQGTVQAWAGLGYMF